MLAQVRQQFPTDSVAGQAPVLIARVRPKSAIAGLFQKFENLGPRDAQQRANQRDTIAQQTGFCHAAQAIQASTAQNAVENRLDLVVLMVRRGNVPGTNFAGGLVQKRVPRRTGVLFQSVGRAWNFQPSGNQWHFQLFTEFPHEALILIRFRTAQLVVGMSRNEPSQRGDVRLDGLGADAMKQPQKRHAVRAAGNRDQHGMAEPTEWLVFFKAGFRGSQTAVYHA